MINLIVNEFKKSSLIKLIIIILIFVISIMLLYKFNYINYYSLYKVIPFISISSIVLNNNIISNEINNGTFRYYLTKPIKRYKIYLSKFIYMNIISMIILMFVILTFKSMKISIVITLLIKNIIPLILCNSLILLLSVINKNNTITIIISMLIVIFGFTISVFLFNNNIYFIEYTILPYMDFSVFNDYELLIAFNNETGCNLNMNRALIIDFIYIVIFYILGCVLFIKKDIKY